MENFITEVDILDEAKDNFLTYASEVLTDRSIPAAEDGLLSSQRKILWTMEDYLKMDSKSKTKKCNGIIGSTLATSYFHGDAACYGVLCKMSQEFLMRYPLVIGQGSLGTQENNSIFASSRYTEAKPSQYTDLMMEGFKKNSVPLKETYNGEFMEPVVLPGLFPNAICNGREAIGISMAHNSLPHNLTEVCDGIIAYINNNDLTIDELMEYIKGPDFPLENIIINQKDIKAAFATGHSAVSLKVRGCYRIEGNKIIFYTIPYRTYRNKIKDEISKKVEILEKYIDNFEDESSLGENKLIFEVKPGIAPEAAVEVIFANTPLQTSVSYNMNYIVNGTPKLCSMLDLISSYYIHQSNVLIKIAKFDKDKAERRKIVLEGYIKIIDDIDNAIELIKGSNDKADARNKLIKKYELTEDQANAVLEMRLSSLTKLDRADIFDELKIKIQIIEENDKIINDTSYRDSILIKKIEEMKKTYGDERKTQLLNLTITPKKKEIEKAAVKPENCVVSITASGLIKRVASASFRTQKKGGKGAKSKDDIITDIIKTNTLDSLMVFTNAGTMYKLDVSDIPEGGKIVPIRSLVSIDPKEEPVLIYSIHHDSTAKYLLCVTKSGTVKKTAIGEYTKTVRKTGIPVIKLREGDALAAIALINDEELILASKNGHAIRFSSAEVGASGRTTMGVKGINIGTDDEVKALAVIRDKNDDLGVFTASGLGKRISLSELPAQKRGGKGVTISKTELTNVVMINDSDNVLLVGATGSICIEAKEIPVATRTSQGNILIKGTTLTGVSKT